MSAVAASTLRARLVQWNCYKRFCVKFSINVLPCSSKRLSIYASYLSPFMSYSSIITYLQAVIFVHKINGLEPPSASSPVVKLTLEGIKRSCSSIPHKRDPIKLSHLKSFYGHLDLQRESDLLFWGMCLFLFRTLLRVSHVVISPHTLTWKDVKFKPWGLLVYVRSSKTDQFGSEVVKLPVYRIINTKFCAVFWLRAIRDCQGPQYRGPVFSLPMVPQVSYSWFQSKLKNLARACNIKSHLSTHSFCKGGANFLASCVVPLNQIKARGMWKSLSVFKYLAEPTNVKICQEKAYGANFECGLAFG